MSQDLIDWQTLQDATNRPHTDGPDVLLTYLEQRINGEPSLLGRVLDVMEMEDPLHEIVRRIRKKLIKNQLDSAGISVFFYNYSSLLINIFMNYFLKLSLQQKFSFFCLKFRKNALIITFSAFLARTSLVFSKPERILDELQCEREKRNWKRKLKLRLRLFFEANWHFKVYFNGEFKRSQNLLLPSFHDFSLFYNCLVLHSTCFFLNCQL